MMRVPSIRGPYWRFACALLAVSLTFSSIPWMPSSAWADAASTLRSRSTKDDPALSQFLEREIHDPNQPHPVNDTMLALVTPQPVVIPTNPLIGLRDPNMRRAFKTLLLTQRLDTTLFSDFYQLGQSPLGLTWEGQQGSPERLADAIIDFLTLHSNDDPQEVVRVFQSKFLIPGGGVAEPPELLSLEQSYNRIRERVFGIALIKHALPVGTIVDYGAGQGLFGQALLNYSDEQHLGIEQVIATDVHGWQARADDSWAGRFIGTIVHSPHLPPIPFGIADGIVTRYALHHMTAEQQRQAVQHMSTLLKPGGRVIVIEGLLADRSEVTNALAASRADQNVWPHPWDELSWRFTQDYLDLTKDQQQELLLLEDWYGHHLVRHRHWMPLPGTYLDISEIRQLFTQEGFSELLELRRVFGFAPIIRRAPFTACLVFEKPNPLLQSPYPLPTIRVRIPPPLQHFTQGQGEVEMFGSTLGAILEHLEASFPGIRPFVVDVDGYVRPSIVVYVVNGPSIQRALKLQTPLRAGDTVEIALADTDASGENRIESSARRTVVVPASAVPTTLASPVATVIEALGNRATQELERPVQAGREAGRSS